MKMAPYFIGIDAGTTIIKAVLFNIEGKKVRESARENEIIFFQGDGAEIDLDAYWNRVADCIQEVASKSRLDKGAIKGLSIAANGVTFMPVSKSGKALRRAFSYLDTRGTEEAEELISTFGQRILFANTGQPHLMPLHVIVKMLWIKHHEPEIFSKTDKLAMVHDYLMFKLTGQWRATRSLAATTGFVKLRDGTLWDEAVEFVGMQPENMCPISNGGETIGTVLPKRAEALGLSSDTLVVCGSLDQAAGCIGSGNIDHGSVTESTGTVLAINATVNDPHIDYNKPVPCFSHALRDKFIMLPWCPSGGRVLKWFRDEFFQSTEHGEAVDYSEVISGVETVPAGCEGLIMLPHLAGANSPEFNENARGVFFNIDFQHTRSHFVRAILESMGYVIRRNLELLQSLEMDFEALCSIGGGARSRIWNQMKSDILQIPIRTCEIEEVGALGAGILAAVGCGVFDSIEEGCNHFVRFNKTYEPDNTKSQIYQGCYEKYMELYNQVEALFPSVGKA